MHFSWPQTEECWRDTLVHKAERSAFDRIATMYNFTWAKAIPENSWRKALKLVAMGPRDLFPTLFGAVEGIFQGYNQVFQNISYVPGVQKQLYRDDGWDKTHVYRYVRIGSKLYFSTGIYGVDKYLRLSEHPSSYWDAAAWDEVVSLTPVGEDVNLLPFRVYERTAGPTYPGWNGATYSGNVQCTTEFVFLPYVTNVPETFLVSPTDYANATPGACPLADGPQAPGDTPICTTDDFPDGGYMFPTDIDDFEYSASQIVTASNASGDLLFTTSSPHGFYKYFIVRVTADLGGSVPTGISSTTDYYVKPVSTVTFKLSATSEGSPVAYTDAGVATFRVQQSLLGLNVAESEAYPLYLFDGQVSPEVEEQLNKLCPAGSHVLLRSSVV